MDDSKGWTIPTEPLAQEFTVVTRINPIPDPETGEFTISDAPSLLRLPNGNLLCATPLLLRPRNEGRLLFHISTDEGAHWNELPHELEFRCGRLIEQGDTIYFLGAGRRQNGGIGISRSDDGGLHWSDPVRLFEGSYYNAATACVVRNGQLYWCFGAPNTQGRGNSKGSRTMVVAADFSRDLTDPGGWRRSEFLTYPGTPPSLRSAAFDTPDEPYYDHWLEGNVVEVGDRLRVLWRTRIDRSSTCSVCAVCDLDDNGTTLDFRFSRFYPVPGAQNHFHIIWDEKSDLFWMTSNLQTMHGTRRILALHCSFDVLNWLPAGYLVIFSQSTQACNYVGPLIDGSDLLIACRTAYNAPNHHDNDLVTFHRVKDFRALAGPLKPTSPETTFGE